MTTILRTACLGVLIIATGCSSTNLVLESYAPFERAEQRLVGVMPIENKTGDTAHDKTLQGLSGKLITALRETRRYRVIERERLGEVFKEHALRQTGAISASKAAEIGKILGVDTVVLSSVSGLQFKKGRLMGGIAWINRRSAQAAMEARTVDVKTGEVLSSASVSAEVRDREWVAFGVLRAGGKQDQAALEAQALDHVVRKAANALGKSAVKQ